MKVETYSGIMGIAIVMAADGGCGGGDGGGGGGGGGDDGGGDYSGDLEKAVAPHSSTSAWKTPWTEEPGRLQSMGSLRVGQN